jgi:hypothetical protein
MGTSAEIMSPLKHEIGKSEQEHNYHDLTFPQEVNQMEACRRISAGDEQWPVVRGSDLAEGYHRRRLLRIEQVT